MKFKYLFILLLISLITIVNAAVPVSNFAGNVTSGGIPLPILFTDSSTNIPTGWTWFFGDETYNQMWTRMNASSGWSSRLGHTTVGLLNGNIVLMGGVAGSALNDTWISSNNGVTWTQINASSGWTRRSGHVSVVLSDGSIILTGGADAGVKNNDTWRSIDGGTTWILQNNKSQWQPRDYPALLVMANGNLILTGGRTTTNSNETWKSTDQGITWTLQNASSGWTGRYYSTLFLLPNQSIILYGGSDGTRRNDTWISTNEGVTWNNITISSPPVARSSPGISMPDGSIILTGGTNGTKSNDTWRSINGITWTQVNPSSGYTPRSDFAVSKMSDGSIILTGGNDGSNKNDAWRYVPAGSILQNPVHTYTVTGIYTVSLQTYNSDGYNTTEKINYITATGAIPVTNFTSNITSGGSPLPVSFSDASTNSPSTWNWSFKNVTGNNTEIWWSTSQNPILTFGIGNFSIKLNASNINGYNITPTTYFINVSLVAISPISTFITNGTMGIAPLPIAFTDTSLNNPITWSWSFKNVAGNNTEIWWSVSQNPILTFDTGNFSIKLTSSNSGGSNISVQHTFINVTPRLYPIANFTANITTGTAPLPVAFTDTSTNNPTGWTWFFGDEKYNQSWLQLTPTASWSPRISFSGITLPDGSVVIMGGWDGNYTGGHTNDTWRSTDNGVTWTLMNASSGWSARYGHTSVVCPNGNIVLMGGEDNSGRKNDTWRSVDNGATWTLLNASSGWTARYYATSVAMQDGGIILMGGRSNGTIKNDTWRSIDDGITWARMNASSGWSARYYATSVSLTNNSILLMGGMELIFRKNDTWKSLDNGATWTLENPSSGWTARAGHTTVRLLNDDILLMGGWDGTSHNDTWVSKDNGKTWMQTNASSAWTARADHISIPLRNSSIVLLGGSDGNYKNDIWEIIPVGSALQNPIHIYTTVINNSVVLQASNNYGFNQTPLKYLINISAAPISDFTSNLTIGTGYALKVQFNDTSVNLPTTWNWSFGDGRWFNTTNPSLKNPIYQYSVAGKYNVSLLTNNTIGNNITIKTNYINLTSDTDALLHSWLHMNGANGGILFIDEAGNAWSPISVTTSNTQIKYGNASAQFNADTDHLDASSGTAFNISSGNFTLEMWVYPDTATSTENILISRTTNTLANGWGIHQVSGATSSNWRFWMGNASVNSTNPFILPLNTWTHLVVQGITIDGGNTRNVTVYLNGTPTVTILLNGSFDTADPVRFGDLGTGVLSFRGYIDEFRFSNTIRWVNTFTSPYAEYRGLLESVYFDINPDSILRYNVDPDQITYIDNITNGGTRNRTIQIENIISTQYIAGSIRFNPLYIQGRSLQLNTSDYPTGMTLVSSNIDNLNGAIEFNISKPTGFTPGFTRASILDYTTLYYNYTNGLENVSQYFGYGYLINTTINTYYPVHNFVVTQLTVEDWNFTADFTADNLIPITGNPVTFTSSFTGSYPNRWRWSFGDGTINDGTNSTISHVYTTGDYKTVTLTEYLWQNNNVSNTIIKTDYILVLDRSPIADFTSISSGGPTPPVTVQFTDASSNYPSLWNWSFGDDNVSSVQNPIHTYDFCGNYTVLLRVENSAGVSWNNKTDNVIVSCAPPPPPTGPTEKLTNKMTDIQNFVVLAAIVLSIAFIVTFIARHITKKS